MCSWHYVISTASVLPFTADAVYDLLSVIFIGPGKYSKECLKQTFHVWKHKIWAFLVWLKKNNPLYKKIPLSIENLNMYPDEDVIPNIDNRVIFEKRCWYTKVTCRRDSRN